MNIIKALSEQLTEEGIHNNLGSTMDYITVSTKVGKFAHLMLIDEVIIITHGFTTQYELADPNCIQQVIDYLREAQCPETLTPIPASFPP